MYPPLRQAEWIKFIGLLITSENFCTLKIQKKFGTTTIALQKRLRLVIGKSRHTCLF